MQLALSQHSANRRNNSRHDSPASISSRVPELETSVQFPLLPLASTVIETAITASINPSFAQR